MKFNWFGKSKDMFEKEDVVEIPDLKEIKLVPEIILPEKTQRDLYDDAVKEVQFKRVHALILKSLRDYAITDAERKSNLKVISEFGPCVNEEVKRDILKVYPRTTFYYLGDTVGNQCYRILEGRPNLSTLAEVLALQYLSD